MKSEPKVIVCQYGARRRYLIPQILHTNNMLRALYTDSNCTSIIGKIAAILIKCGINFPMFSRLVNRNPGLPKSLVKSSDKWQLKIITTGFINKGVLPYIEAVFEGGSKHFIRWGVKDADWLYTMHIENIEFVKFAKQKGLKILADIYENPYIFSDLCKEIDDNVEYECLKRLKSTFIAQSELRAKYVDEILQLADQYLIPSDFVCEELQRSPYFNKSKANIIPYVSSVHRGGFKNVPKKGRIIWIGNDPIRKGLVYLLRAFESIKSKYNDIELRVIGPMPHEILESPYFKNVTFLGYLNKPQLTREFITADIFVFPSLSEGFAGALLEAAEFGIPIIATRAAGCNNDFPGIIVEPKDSAALEREIVILLEDRKKRNSISKALIDYSQKINKDNFSNKLISLLKSK